MRCKICGRNSPRYAKIRKGVICEDCYDSMPRLIKDNVYDLTSRQILNSCRIMKRTSDRKGYWAYVGMWDDENPILFANDRLSVKDTEILYSDLDDISLVFHPVSRQLGNHVSGRSVLRIKTLKPKIILEIELPFKGYSLDAEESIRYDIYGDEISYRFYGIDKYVVKIVKEIISGQRKGLDEVKERYLSMLDDLERTGDNTRSYCITEEERQFRENLKNKKESEERERQQRYNEERSRRSRGEWSSSSGRRENTGNSSTSADSMLDKAKKMFGLEIPFSERELKEKRNKLIRSAHPDEGGSNEAASLINEYYDILKRFAVPAKG